MEESTSSKKENHMQSVLQAVAVIILGWVWYTVDDTANSVLVVSTEMKVVQQDVRDLRVDVRTNMDDRFRRDDWVAESAPIVQQILDHERRLDEAEKLLSILKEKCKSC